MALTQVNTGGVEDGGIHSADIADNAVTGDKLNDTGVTAGTYGSSSAIPSLTVDAQGRVTSASTNSIDSTSISNGTSNVSVASNSDITIRRNNVLVTTFDGNGFRTNDGGRCGFGNDLDLTIGHTGSYSYIRDTGTGNLVIAGDNNVDIYNSSLNEAKAKFITNGPVELYYDNSKKFHTTSTGATVTGTLVATAFSGDGSALTGITSFVTGMILMFTGSTAPSGWAICDGTNGTPDLRDRFVVGQGTTYSINDTGGSKDAVIPTHNHGAGNYSAASHAHGTGNYTVGSHTHGDGNYAAASHTHSDGNYAAASHSHGDGNYTAASHTHNFKASNRAGDEDSWNNSAKAFIGDHDNAAFTRSGTNKIFNSGALAVNGNSSNSAPNVTGNSGSSAPNVTGTSGSTTPSFSGNSANATPSVSGNSANAGVTATDKNLPPYYALAYIMKT